MLKVLVGIVKEKDDTVKFKKVERTSDAFDKLQSEISPENNEVNFISLDQLEIGKNLLVLLDANPSISRGGYNFTIHIYPLFGDLAFFEFGIDNDGNTIIVDMSKSNQEILKEFVQKQKLFEKNNGGRKAIIDRINEVGKEKYLDDLNERYENLFSEDGNDD